MREPPKIISMVKINGEWVNQDSIPPGTMKKIVEETIKRAAANIGFAVVPQKEKSA